MRNRLWSLLDPIGGSVSRFTHYGSLPDEPRLCIVATRFPSELHTIEGCRRGKERFRSASGTGRSIEDAVTPALGEMLERQGSISIDNHRIFSASPRELGTYGLDLKTLPRCSKREFSHPKCRLSPPSFDLPIRWIEGISLLTGKRTAVPHTLVYLYPGDVFPHERLQSPISTGLASHVDLTRALVSALLEVIERDSLSIMWLQRIAGSRIDLSILDEELSGWMSNRSSHLEYVFTNIETDLGIPVVCCLRRAPDNAAAHTLISCSAGFNVRSLVAKAARDIGAQGVGFRAPREVPEQWDDFVQIHHGATYMAAKERGHAFDFMLASDIEMSTLTSEPTAPRDQLRHILRVLANRNCEAYAVDLTTAEAVSVGMSVVRVIIPGLQPLPYVYASRYLGHDRLYDAPRAMGATIHCEKDINPWPMPFA